MPAGISAKANIDGAKKFQDDLKNMTAKSKALSAQMNEMSTRFDKEGKSMGDNTKARKLANEQIDAQKQKISLLEAELKRLEQAGQGESTQAYKLREQLAKANTELINMQHSSGKAAAAGKDGTASMLKMAAAAGAIAVAVKGAVSAIKSIAGAASNAAKAIWNLGVESGKWADELITLSAQTGVDVETLQEWGYAARFIDTEVGTMTKGMTKLTKAYAKGAASKKKIVKIAKGVTVSLKDENGQIKSQSQFFLDTIDALHGMTNEAQRNKAAQEIFGKSYTDLLPLINSGTQAIREYSAEARDMGVIISGENVNALGGFDDTMQRLGATFDAIKTNLAVAFLPILEVVAGRIQTFMGVVSKALEDGIQPEDVDTIVDAFLDMFKFNPEGEEESASAFAFIGGLIGKLKTAVSEHEEDIKSIAKSIMSFIWTAFKESIGINPEVEFAAPDKQTKSTAQKRWLESLGISPDATADEIRSAVTESTGILDKDQTIWQRISSWWSSLWNKSNEEAAAILEREGVPSDFVEKWYQSAQSNEQAPTDAGGASVDAYAAGIDGNQQPVDDAGETTVDTFEGAVASAAQMQTYEQWGYEMVSNYARGMNRGIPLVSQASARTAKASGGALHFSKPDFGPLRDVGKWGGEMIAQYIAGIDRNAWKVSSAINGALSAPSFTPMGKTMNLGGVTIVVNGAAGQDVNSLADIIMERLQSAVDRREAVFA